MFKKTIKRTSRLILVVGLLLVSVAATLAQGMDRQSLQRADRASVDRPLPAALGELKLDQPLTADGDALMGGLHASLFGQSGTQRVVVRLNQPSLAAAGVEGIEPSARASNRQAIKMQQDMVVANARSLDSGVRVLGAVDVVMNAVMLEVDGAALQALAADPNVVSINPVIDYQMDLSETVSYIGAAEVQQVDGYDGSGVKVAVLDSGIDYLHAALGGSGDPAEYAANDPTVIEPGTFPTAKVVGGYDFIGSQWFGGAGSPPEAPDPDPLDDGPGAGHGTHVSHIIAGVGGVAPGADLYAVKVCSSISTSCSGVSIINGLNWALDPDGDGDTSDRMDIVNMSLGANMGDPTVDDTSFAVEQLAAAGILVVNSAGNGSDIPYIHGTAASSPSALSVAQTNVPSAVQPIMDVIAPDDIVGQYPAVFQAWSVSLEDTGRIEGPLQYGDGSGGNLDGCAPFAPGSLAGKIVLVDRGACNFTLKIKNISDGGGLAGIIGLIAPGDPFVGGDGGDRPINIPGFMISQGVANTLRSGLPDTVVVFDPANGIPLVGHMVGSSSRGPNIALNQVKPEIGAPGASVSAVAGSGTGTTPFSGTSGAAPMVSGSAALLMQAYPDRSWAEIKAVLVNNGETNIMNEPAFFGGDLAPITRIGGGEVRVDDALHSDLAAWERTTNLPSLSWGFHDVTGNVTLVKRVIIQNYTGRNILLKTVPEFRFDNDTGGEVRISAPSYFTVPSHGSIGIPVHLFIRPYQDTPLHDWAMNAGSGGADADRLTFNEYDGYLHFVEAGNESNSIHLPWQVLPRAAGDIEIGAQQTGFDWVRNQGVGLSFIDTYSLIGTSPNDSVDPQPGQQQLLPDLRYVGVQTFPVPAGFCSDVPSFVMSFAVNTWDRQTHPNPTSFQFELDTNTDGTPDYIVLNRDFTLTNVTDGRNLTWVVDLATGLADAFFFTTHYTNSANTVLTFCGEQIGMNADDMLVTEIDIDVFAQDFYYGGPGDLLEGLNIVPLGERFFTIFQNGDVQFTVLPPKSDKLGYFIIDFGEQFNDSEVGVMALFGPGAPADNEVEVGIFVP